MREIVVYGVERALAVVGWSALTVAALLLGVAVVWHLDYSPFATPGATPDHNRMGLLTLDGMRWCAIVIGCSVAAIKSAPQADDRLAANWLVPPIVTLLVTMVMSVAATIAWLAWMDRLPAGDLQGNAALATVYFAVPTALILSAALHMRRRRRSRRPKERLSRDPGPPARADSRPPAGRPVRRPGASSNRGRTGRR